MINIIFRLFLTLNATSLLVIIYMIKSDVELDDIISAGFICSFPEILSYLIYVTVPVVLTALSLKLTKCLGSDAFSQGEVVEIEYANNSFLPSYLGYFFVALSIPDLTTMIFVYGILFVFTFLSQALYFNPIFLVFGYKFYNIKSQNGLTLFLVSRSSYRNPSSVVIKKAYRINDYTFIERE